MAVAEKEREELLRDIDKLSKIRDRKNTIFNKEIKRLIEYKKALAQQVQVMFRKIQLLTSDVVGLQKSYDEFGVSVFDEITELANDILSEATNEYYEIARKSKDLDTQKRAVTQKERILHEKEVNLQVETHSVAQKRLLAEEMGADSLKKAEALEERVEDVAQSEKKADRELESAELKHSRADERDKTSKVMATEREKELEERRKRIKRQQVDVVSKEFTQGRERDRLVKKDILLKDKEGRLMRAANELKQKGV